MNIKSNPGKEILNIHTKQKVSFTAGLTSKMMQEIHQTDVLEVSVKLAKKGIPTDLKGNKVIAWCCDKSVEIFQQLNEKFGQKLTLPKGIYVEDFRDLNVENPSALGTCNLLRSELKKGSSVIVPSRTIFFNSIHDWNSIDAISDNQYAAKHFSIDHFIYAFLHEFSHAFHEDRLLSKLGGKRLAKTLETLSETEQLQKYRDTYGQSVRQICNYAENTPLDAIACDISRTIATSLDKETLMPTKNPFIGTPYEKIHFWQKTPKYSDQDRPLSEILRNFWNGKFE